MLPQYPDPSSKSEDTISTFFNISLLFPIRVIPLILFVILPFSISLAVSTAKLKSPVASSNNSEFGNTFVQDDDDDEGFSTF